MSKPTPTLSPREIRLIREAVASELLPLKKELRAMNRKMVALEKDVKTARRAVSVPPYLNM